MLSLQWPARNPLILGFAGGESCQSQLENCGQSQPGQGQFKWSFAHSMTYSKWWAAIDIPVYNSIYNINIVVYYMVYTYYSIYMVVLNSVCMTNKYLIVHAYYHTGGIDTPAAWTQFAAASSAAWLYFAAAWNYADSWSWLLLITAPRLGSEESDSNR